MINNVLKSKRVSNHIPNILINENRIQDPLVIAEEFNNYFANIGPNLAQNIPVSDLHFQYFLETKNTNSMFCTPILEHEVIDIVKNMKTKKCAGNDGITNFILKEIIGENSFSSYPYA